MWYRDIHSIKNIFSFLKRKIGVVLIAFMLGMSNAILEETRMVNDTRKHLQIEEVAPDDLESDEDDAIYS